MGRRSNGWAYQRVFTSPSIAWRPSAAGWSVTVDDPPTWGKSDGSEVSRSAERGSVRTALPLTVRTSSRVTGKSRSKP